MENERKEEGGGDEKNLSSMPIELELIEMEWGLQASERELLVIARSYGIFTIRAE